MCGGGLLKPGRSVTIAALIGFLNIGSAIQALAQTDSAAKRHFDLQLKDGRIANAFKTIEVQRGDAVELIWTADRETRIHLHGYDLEMTIQPDKSQAMNFAANATGRFPIHDGRHKLLIYLEVRPR